jgi:fucose permease
VRAFGTGSSVVIALIGASVMPYVAGKVFDVADVVGLFGMVAVMYFDMAATVFLMMVETKDRSLEEVSEV